MVWALDEEVDDERRLMRLSLQEVKFATGRLPLFSVGEDT